MHRAPTSRAHPPGGRTFFDSASLQRVYRAPKPSRLHVVSQRLIRLGTSDRLCDRRGAGAAVAAAAPDRWFNMQPDEVAELHAKCAQAGQEHIMEDWDTLSSQEKEQLARDVQELDFGFLKRVLSASLAAAASGGVAVGAEPAADVVRLQDAEPSVRAGWTADGLRRIAGGRVAVLLLAGGQGTRLGSDAPKGCYDIGLPSRKSLFQLQAERIKRLQQLAAPHARPNGGGGGGGTGGGGVTGSGGEQSDARWAAEACGAPVVAAEGAPLRWYIMTSPFTHAATIAHFEQHSYFGLLPSQVAFFQQGFLPCLTEAGAVIMEAPGRIAKAPDGNGGVYRVLRSSGVLADLAARGVEALDVYCVDNALARPADPEWIGACASAGTQLGCRAIAKAHAGERVGVYARRGGALQVLEYSELDPAAAAAVDPATGQLLYNWANICMHYFDVAWLAATAEAIASGDGAASGAAGASYHAARKAVAARGGGSVPGVKLEMFIFDAFASASRVLLLEVERGEQFAPVKNAPGSGVDAPETARAAILAQGARWVAAAGGDVAPGAGVEVSPLASYAGEGLAPFVVARRRFEGEACQV